MLNIISGAETVEGDNFVYLDLNSPKLVSFSATDDGSVVYNLVNTTSNIAQVTTNQDGTAVVTVTVADTNPVQLRYVTLAVCHPNYQNHNIKKNN